MNQPLKLILAILATYRLARLIPEEEGPLWIFPRLHDYTDRRRKEEQEQGIEYGPWASLDEGLRCPYCVGVWAALFLSILVRYPTPLGEWLLWGLGIAGGHVLLQERKDYYETLQTNGH